MHKPYYEEDGIVLYHGDCREILPELGPVDLVLTDPPYGLGWDGENLSMSAGLRKDGTARKDKTWNQRRAAGYEQGQWDQDRPSETIKQIAHAFSNLIIWGGNYFADVLPVSGGMLIWDKGVSMPTLSKCEVAWTNCISHIEKTFILWAGYRKNEPIQRQHPTQKPVALMEWCLSFVDGQTILDPYMGSGTTGVACVKMGRRFIGIELEESYCGIAANRLRNTTPSLFTPKRPQAEQLTLEAVA